MTQEISGNKAKEIWPQTGRLSPAPIVVRIDAGTPPPYLLPSLIPPCLAPALPPSAHIR